MLKETDIAKEEKNGFNTGVIWLVNGDSEQELAWFGLMAYYLL